MSVSIVAISEGVAAIAVLALSLYFFRDYFAKKLRASFAWGIGFFLFFFALLTDVMVEIGGEVVVGKLGLFFGMMIVAVAMTLFYYGTSLLFFSVGSFFREKFSAILILFYVLFFSYLVLTLPVEGFRKTVLIPVQLILQTPIYFTIGTLFLRISRRLSADDPRRQTIFLVSAGWFLVMMNSIYRGIFLGYSGTSDALFHVILAFGWVLVMYGMILGKAGKT